MSNNTQVIKDLNRYCSPNSILVLDKYGKLLRLYCPFQVHPKQQVHIIQEDQVYQVTAVRLSDDLLLLFVIGNIAYPYYYFIIM